jgi:hypothetical protein
MQHADIAAKAVVPPFLAAGILEQGSRLQEVVQQLQAALHPSAAAAVVPSALLQAGDGRRQRKALPQNSSSSGGSSSSSSDDKSAGQWQLLEPGAGRPALPSSSIGRDFQAIEVSTEEPACSQAGPGSQPPDAAVPSSVSGSSSIVPVFGSRASADLLNVLMPLLASASNFAAVSGVSFAMAEPSSGHADGRPNTLTNRGGAATGAPRQPLVLPAVEVAVGPGKLKRMLSQLIDGVIACAARGDHVQASVLQQQWQGRPGVAVSLCCCRSLAHGGGGSIAGLPHPPMQPEFAFLRGSAAEASGYFEVSSSALPGGQRLSSSALTATLWLPVVAQDAGWT